MGLARRKLLVNPKIDDLMQHCRTFIILAIFLLLTSACAGVKDPPLPTQAAAGTPAPMPIAAADSRPAAASQGTGTFFSIAEVGVGEDGYVALTNFTGSPAGLKGLSLCQGAACFALPDMVVEPGKTVRIAAGDGAGPEAAAAAHAALGELRPADGEIALFASPEPGSAPVMLIYFQWGSTPHALTQQAIDAGLWLPAGYGPTSPDASRLYKDAKSGLWLFEEPK
jgi:hypothetical protein